MKIIFARMIEFSGSINSNMLSEILREARELPWQPNLGKICQNCNKLIYNFGAMQTTFKITKICVHGICFG